MKKYGKSSETFAQYFLTKIKNQKQG